MHGQTKRFFYDGMPELVSCYCCFVANHIAVNRINPGELINPDSFAFFCVVGWIGVKADWVRSLVVTTVYLDLTELFLKFLQVVFKGF